MKINIKNIIKSKKTIFVVLAGLVLVGFVGFLNYRNAVFSKEILRLEILGPEHASLGEEIEYTVKYKNNGNFTLEQVKITFELPEHSLTEDGKLRLTQNVKDLYPGDESFVKFKTRLLGKEGDLKVARAKLLYVPHNLSAKYESDTTFTTKIETVPITLEFDLPSKIEKNKEMTYAVNYFSNVEYPLENLSIKIDPALGFVIESADPPSLDNVEWKLDVVSRAQGGRIKIKGVVVGDTGSRLNFSAHLRMRVNGTFITLKDVSQEVEVIQPQLFISQQINGSAIYTANAGDTLNYQVTFKNTGEKQLDAMSATAKLSGSAFDFTTLQSGQNQVQAGDAVSFQLPSLALGQEVSSSFSIKLKNTISDADKIIKTTVTASGITQEFTTNINDGSANPPFLDLNLGQ